MSEDSGEFYKPQATVDIKATEVHRDNLVKSPFELTAPFVSTGLQKQPEQDLLTKLKLRKQVIEPDSPYARLSSEHGRALVDTDINRMVVWGGDLSGDINGGVDYKGGVMDNPVVISDEYSPYGFRVQGLKDNVGLDRIKKASVFLRSHGLPTETPAAIDQIEEVIDQGRRLPIQEWKNQQSAVWLQEAARLRKQGKTDEAVVEETRARNVKDYLASTDFYIIERHVQVAERLRDLKVPMSSKTFQQIVEPVFRWVNVVAETKKSGVIPDTQPPEKFEFTDQGIKRYFGEWLPAQMGVYLARMHKLGVADGYAHAQNWSAVGTLYDLDSFHGEPLNGKKLSEKDYQSDTRKTGGAILELMGGGGYLYNQYPHLYIEAESTFITNYISERFGRISDVGQIEELKSKYFSDLMNFSGKNHNLPDQVWEKVKKNLGVGLASVAEAV